MNTQLIQPIFFYSISGILIFSALMVVTQRALFTCAFYLAVMLSMVAGFFVLLGADFLAAVQILLYVGGILVILVFAIMLSSVQQSKGKTQVNQQWVPSLLVCASILALILFGIFKNPFTSRPGYHLPTTDSIGKLLLGDMVLPFELISLVLLASLIGAVLFSKKEVKGTDDH